MQAIWRLFVYSIKASTSGNLLGFKKNIYEGGPVLWELAGNQPGTEVEPAK